MVTLLDKNTNEHTSEYTSGEVVEPGVYVDVETGAIVKVNERDELPQGRRVVMYRRRFRRVDSPGANN
jgi:hypothetical protein